jgi:hypothetical protein
MKLKLGELKAEMEMPAQQAVPAHVCVVTLILLEAKL